MPCHAIPEPLVPARAHILLAPCGDDDALRQCVCVFGSLQDFRIITATGTTQTQMQLTAMIDCAHACIDSPGEGGGEPAFQIRIRNVELLQVFAGTPQSYLLTYEEFQHTQVCQDPHACVTQYCACRHHCKRARAGARTHTQSAQTRRKTTVILREADGCPNGLEWVHTHETFLPVEA